MSCIKNRVNITLGPLISLNLIDKNSHKEVKAILGVSGKFHEFLAISYVLVSNAVYRSHAQVSQKHTPHI
jgi:hypothetical protein